VTASGPVPLVVPPTRALTRSLTGRLWAGEGGSGYAENLVYADGTHDYLTVGTTGFAGSGAAARVMTVAVLVNRETLGNLYIFGHWGSRHALFFTTNKLEYRADVSFSPVVQVRSSGTYGTGRLAVLCAFNTNIPVAQMYVNDVDVADVLTLTQDAEPDWLDTDLGIAARSNGNNKWQGCIGDVWMTQEYVDISVEANRRKFFNGDGTLVDKGADGSLPTGTQPIRFHRGPAANFATNLGSGPAMTVNGVFTECAL